MKFTFLRELFLLRQFCSYFTLAVPIICFFNKATIISVCDTIHCVYVHAYVVCWCVFLRLAFLCCYWTFVLLSLVSAEVRVWVSSFTCSTPTLETRTLFYQKPFPTTGPGTENKRNYVSPSLKMGVLFDSAQLLAIRLQLHFVRKFSLHQNLIKAKNKLVSISLPGVDSCVCETLPFWKDQHMLGFGCWSPLRYGSVPI